MTNYPPHNENPFMRGHAPLSPLTGVPGWLSDAEQRVLAAYARRLPPGVPVIEIGSEMGCSTSILAYYTGVRTRILCLDINPDIPAPHNLQQAELSQNVEFWFVDSGTVTLTDAIDAGYLPDATPPALVFIDGDHSEAAVYNDLKNWGDAVMPGGYLILHDIAIDTNRQPHRQHYDVKKAYDRWRAGHAPDEWNRIDSRDRLLVLQRKAS